MIERRPFGRTGHRNITRGMNDMLIGEYAKQHAALYNTVPALVEHIGHLSCFH